MSGSKKTDFPVPMRGNIRKFWEEREALNDTVLNNAGLVTKRFFNLDHQAYQDGALPVKTKELLGLVASLVLRCDDCISYHIVRCKENGITKEEIEEAMSIGLVVGGSITLPHLRRAFRAWDDLQPEQPDK